MSQIEGASLSSPSRVLAELQRLPIAEELGKTRLERMAEVVVESDEQVLQHFLSNSNWDERGVLDQVALGRMSHWVVTRKLRC